MDLGTDLRTTAPPPCRVTLTDRRTRRSWEVARSGPADMPLS
ncbi:hypothetical protein BX286_5856 [Streptomyces sp. 3211.6]|nr:hypothetical protein BX286_5856 [Streptomyces sp. 3211.6]